MYIKKKLKKSITAFLVVSALNFVSNVDIDEFIFASSVAHAEIQTYKGVGEYIMSSKETPEFAQSSAKMTAERSIQEQAGIYVSTLSEVQEQTLTKDEIVTFAAGIMKIIKTDVELIPLTGEASGFIKYRVTVTASIDTDTVDEAMNKWMSRSFEERSDMVEQNKAVQKTIDDLKKRINDLENRLSNANGTNNNAKINKKALCAQKIDEANILLYQRSYNAAFKLYNEVLKLNPRSDEAYYGLANIYDASANYKKAAENYTKAIQLNSKVEYYKQRIKLYRFKLYDNIKALEDYTKIIELEPNIVGHYLSRAQFYEHTDNYKQAIEDYLKILELGTSQINWKKSTVYFVVKNCYEKLGDKKMAKEYKRKWKQAEIEGQ